MLVWRKRASLVSHYNGGEVHKRTACRRETRECPGDKTIERILFSDEANAEADKQMNKMTYVFDTSLKNMKNLGNDAQQAMYSFTSHGVGKYTNAPIDIMDKIILAKSTDITMSFLFKEIRLADTTKFKKLVDIHDICDFSKSKVPMEDRSQFRNADNEIFNGQCTIGQLIVYKLLFEDLKIQFTDTPISNKVMHTIFDMAGRKILNGEITLDEFKHMLNKYENFSMRIGTFCNPSISSDMMVLTDEINKRKAELIEENKEALENNDLVVLAKVESELIGMVKSEFRNNPASELYECTASYGNQFKTMAIMTGALPQDDSFNRFKVSTRSLNEGLKKSELVSAMNTAIVGAYSRGKAPEEGGAMAKESGGIFQNVLLDKFSTDCGTTELMDIHIVNAKKYIGRWVKDGGKLVQITTENTNKYNNVTMPMRSVLTCKSKHVCSVCAGEELYKIYEIYDKQINHGLKLNKQQHELVQKRLKLSHDTSIHFSDLNIKDYKESKKKLR